MQQHNAKHNTHIPTNTHLGSLDVLDTDGRSSQFLSLSLGLFHDGLALIQGLFVLRVEFQLKGSGLVAAQDTPVDVGKIKVLFGLTAAEHRQEKGDPDGIQRLFHGSIAFVVFWLVEVDRKQEQIIRSCYVPCV